MTSTPFSVDGEVLEQGMGLVGLLMIVVVLGVTAAMSVLAINRSPAPPHLEVAAPHCRRGGHLRR